MATSSSRSLYLVRSHLGESLRSKKKTEEVCCENSLDVSQKLFLLFVLFASFFFLIVSSCSPEFGLVNSLGMSILRVSP